MSDKTQENLKKQTPKETAVISLAGKQYVVSVGSVIDVDKPFDNFKEGEKVTFESVLFYDDGQTAKVGTPEIKGAKIEAIFLESGKDDKILVWRFRAKSRYSRKYGHRQPYTRLKISAIVA